MLKDKKAIISALATKYDLPLHKIEEIANYQFKFVSKKMKEGKFAGIRLPYFGKFHVNPKRLEHMNNRKKKDETKG
jgi:nucleoid DNA-binding protein|tara:strand:+ start:23345 stop:23572 length:228 start_codon:yes stop_codon:yes gene_type:complete